MKQFNILIFAPLLMLYSICNSANAYEILLAEDFESVDMVPYTHTKSGPPLDPDFSHVLPPGWSVDNSGVTMANDGSALEFAGFKVHKKDSWLNNQGTITYSQGRENFTKGIGNVLVADSDAYDDYAGGGDDFFTVIKTPEIDRNNTSILTLSFDSSSPAYPGSSSKIYKHLNGEATGIEIHDIIYEEEDLRNQNISLAVPFAGETSISFSFAYESVANSWWWAIDNVQVVGEPDTFIFLLLGLIFLLISKINFTDIRKYRAIQIRKISHAQQGAI